jgi:hypothetical protein
MTEFILRQLGASGEQIDRERDRIREELFGSPLAIEVLLPPPERAPGDGEPVPDQHPPPEPTEPAVPPARDGH